MTTVEMAPVTELDLLADLDWEPVVGCEWSQCPDSATWMTVNPACGHDCMVCTRHVETIRAGLVGKVWGVCNCGARCVASTCRFIPIGAGPK